MKKMQIIIIAIIATYLAICMLLYFFQEKLLFHPEKLSASHVFSFDGKFEELHIPTKDNEVLHGLYFKANNARGLIFYLHGNAGSLDSWGEVAGTYTRLNYDVFLLDYRGYGKSSGSITNEQQLYDDVQICYDSMKKKHAEENIVVLGYSIGSGPAAQLASRNHPGLLILQAPYYSMTDLVKQKVPIVPSFILRYKLPTNQYLSACKMPVVVFHGDKDAVINYSASEKLSKLFKAEDQFITLKGLGHNGMTDNPEYQQALASILQHSKNRH